LADDGREAAAVDTLLGWPWLAGNASATRLIEEE
jgi:hypothetical protein